MLPEQWNKEIININAELFNKNSEINWVDETAQQLLKDFNMLDIPLTLQPLKDDPYTDLFKQVRDFVESLHKNQYESYLNLLYRIDLPETNLHHSIPEHAGMDFYDNLTEAILFREFMKVVFRHRYSH